MRSCIVSGTFDPITVGHIDIIARAAKMFDTVFVCVAKTSGKSNSVLTYADKVAIIRDSISRYTLPMSVNYEIQPIEHTLIDTAKALRVNTIVRGLRNATDLIYEMDMSSVNRDLDGEIETVYLPCRPELSYVSSSMIRELCRLGKYGNAKKYCSDLAVDTIHRKRMSLVAITGGIACGKSEVQKMFEKYGWLGIDLDRISEDVLMSNSLDIINTLNSSFGLTNRFSDEDSLPTLKRKIADLIFSDPDAKKKVEEYMHPRITDAMWKRIYSSDAEKIVVQVPLLYETGMDTLFDSVICVTANEDTCVSRMTEFRNMSERAARARIACQMPVEEKANRADYTIINDCVTDFPELERAVTDIIAKMETD